MPRMKKPIAPLTGKRNGHRKETDSMITFSLAEVFTLRSKAFDEIREHTIAIDRTAAALADLDTAMQTAIAERCIDEQQALVTSARRLSAILDGGQV